MCHETLHGCDVQPRWADPSCFAAVQAARAVFDGRVPSPAELVEYARGQELLSQELGGQAAATEAAADAVAAAALRHLHTPAQQQVKLSCSCCMQSSSCLWEESQGLQSAQSQRAGYGMTWGVGCRIDIGPLYMHPVVRCCVSICIYSWSALASAGAWDL